jgi:hypothetical protein
MVTLLAERELTRKGMHEAMGLTGPNMLGVTRLII